jgi:ankyrin repeat protein
MDSTHIIASQCGNKESVRVLLDYGADPAVVNNVSTQEYNELSASPFISLDMK